MKTENLGEIFFDGRVISLDNASDKMLDELLVKINSQKEDCLNNLNNILADIQ